MSDVDGPLQPGAYLKAYLRPLASWLERDDVTDIMINRPGEIWVETVGRPAERVDAPDLTDVILRRLAEQIAAASHQGVNREHPLLAAVLPDGARVQIVAPPATRGPMAIAIRKQVMSDLAVDDYEARGAFLDVTMSNLGSESDVNAALRCHLQAGQVGKFLKAAVQARKNIVVSGGTSTGKTTFLNALIREIPSEERLILIEDTPELILRHSNAVGLVAVRGQLGETAVGADDLLQASLRLRPDRIIMGELRGAEAYSFLRAVNSGHPGALTTVHADSPAAAVEQIALMVLQAGANLQRSEIIDYVRSVVQVAVQLRRVNGRRIVSEVSLD
jgi:type IV secretion system protein VirB11